MVSRANRAPGRTRITHVDLKKRLSQLLGALQVDMRLEANALDDLQLGLSSSFAWSLTVAPDPGFTIQEKLAKANTGHDQHHLPEKPQGDTMITLEGNCTLAERALWLHRRQRRSSYRGSMDRAPPRTFTLASWMSQGQTILRRYSAQIFGAWKVAIANWNHLSDGPFLASFGELTGVSRQSADSCVGGLTRG